MCIYVPYLYIKMVTQSPAYLYAQGNPKSGAQDQTSKFKIWEQTSKFKDRCILFIRSRKTKNRCSRTNIEFRCLFLPFIRSRETKMRCQRTKYENANKREGQVCVYICMYICMRIYIHIYIYIHVRIYICIYIYVYIYIYMFTFIHIYAFVCYI